MKNIKEILEPKTKSLKLFNESNLTALCQASGLELQKFKPQTAGDIRKKDIKEREIYLGYLIKSQMIVNFAAPSGICKSWLAMYLCAGMATAGECLNLKAPKPRKIVYLDAEMPEIDIKNRMESFSKGFTDDELALFDNNFTIMNIDSADQNLPDLTSELGQQIVAYYCKGADVLVIDNYISVFPDTDDKDTLKMKQFTDWLREMRASGLTIITINHTTKDLKRLGSVVLDTYNDLTIDIREPKPDSKGANKDVKKDYLSLLFGKTRHLSSEQKEPIFFKFNIDDNGVDFWRVKPT